MNMKKMKKVKAKMSSPLSWLGGKRILAPYIVPLIPEHTCYCEPFAGGAWVFFAKPPSKSEVINDVNRSLVTLYRVVRDNYEEFIQSFKNELCSRSQFGEYLYDLHDVERRKKLTDVEIAHRFFYLVKLSFAGQGKTFGTGTTGKPRLNLGKIPEVIEKAHKRLSRVLIECLDYRRIISKYDREHTFYYIDPPYRTPSARSYAQWFVDGDFVALRDILRSVKGKFLLSLNSDQFIYDLFSPYFRIEKVKTIYTVQAAGNKEVEELLIMNYDPAGLDPDT